jgi:RNA polymerase sigma-70 factor (ECF subfamily)
MTDCQVLTEDLIAQCLKGQQQAYEALYGLYAEGVYRLCYSLLLNREDAEDVMQESFVYAFKNIKRYEPKRSAFRTWLFTIAISRCRNQYRRQRPLSIDFTQLLSLGLLGPKDEWPEVAATRKDAREAIEQALTALNPRLREAVVLRYGHGLTYREIAEVMDCPQKTAESRVRLAHESLRGVLQQAGHGLLDELLASE